MNQLGGNILTLIVLIGCSSQIVIEDPSIPDLLIEKSPYNVAIIYPENFNNFVHEEKVIGKKSWTIDFSESNKILFNKVFSSFFSAADVFLSDSEINSSNYKFIIKPNIDVIEFSVPEQSQDETFSVWIRYRIKIYDSTGTELINWPISSYGKTSTSTFANEQDLARAAVLAMRDAAALIILQMEKSKIIEKS
jgi:hypothetical protein